jgi:hypothetical protein
MFVTEERGTLGLLSQLEHWSCAQVSETKLLRNTKFLAIIKPMMFNIGISDHLSIH